MSGLVEVVDPAPAAVHLVREVEARKDREALREKVLVLLRQADSTGDLLQAVLEAHLELMREQLVEDRRRLNAPTARWSLEARFARRFGAIGPELLERFVEELREQELRDLEAM